MRTSGLGGDSAVHVVEGLDGGLHLGPCRLMPISLAAMKFPKLVHDGLDRALAQDMPALDGGQFVIPQWDVLPAGLERREAAIVARLADGPLRLGQAVQSRTEDPALARLVGRGLVMLAGATPSDAAHVLGRVDAWDSDAATKALTLFARRRIGSGRRIADGPVTLAQMIVDQLTAQTVDCLLQTAFAEDSRDWGDPAVLARHPLTMAGLDGHQGLLQMRTVVGVPVIGLGASARAYYGPVGDRLGTRMIVPDHADVANAIGAVVGQVAMQASGVVTSAGAGVYVVHLPDGPQRFADRDTAMTALETALADDARARARAAGVEDMRITTDRDIDEVAIEGQPMFIEARIRVTAQGRPRIALG